MSKVALTKISGNKVEEAISSVLEMIDKDLPTRAHKIVIKPNLCYYWDYTTGETTDPNFVKALIKVLRNRLGEDVEISIVESDASAMKCNLAFKMLGYEKLAEEMNVRLVNLSEELTKIVSVKTGEKSFTFNVPNSINDADFKINVPKVKYTVEGLEITCALKNIFGCNPYPKKYKYHPIIDEVIVALNKIMNFDLVIVDGNIVSGIKPKRLGLVMASRDPVSVDSVAARITGVNKPIRYITLAEQEKVGSTKFTCKGADLNFFITAYPQKRIKEKAFRRMSKLAVTLGMGKKLGL